MAVAKEAVKQKQKSYFAKDVVNRFMLDDEESFIEHKKLDEGLFQAYQDLTSKIRLTGEGDTEVDMALGKQRQFLLENLVVGWNMVVYDEKDGEEIPNPVKFSHARLFELPPELIADLVVDIYKKNPILSGEEDTSGK